MIFENISEMKKALLNHDVTLQTKVGVRIKKDEKDPGKIVNSSVGRFIYNEGIPQDLGYVNRKEDPYSLEVDQVTSSGVLKEIVDRCFRKHGNIKTASVLDYIKSTGYKFSTLSGLTVSMSDVTIPHQKWDIVSKADSEVDKYEKLYRRGFITDNERYEKVIDIWREATDEVTAALLDELKSDNNIKIFADSGARGSNQQIKQLAGMRGLMADTTGKTIELPIKSNFREGLDVLEYFISAHGARKGLSDTALRTADSGYLTRRLVDVSQDLIIREPDCSIGRDSIPGMVIEAFREGKEMIEEFQERITGRYLAESVYDAEGNMLVKINHMVTPKRAELIVKKGVDANGVPFTVKDDDGNEVVRSDAKLKIRTVLTCKSHLGVCAKCYGANMATGMPVQVGESVGIIAAQSIGEPGTQLTMRTFHTGGVAGGDITQGLPRVEELFEARKPKGLAIIAEFGGKVQLRDNKKKREVVITNDETGESKAYLIPYGSRIRVLDDQVLEAGDELTEGSVNPHDILKIKGVRAVQDYMLREVQKVYRLQGVDINDKHIEIIVRQMLKKIIIDEPGDSDYLPGTQADLLEFEDTNEKLIAEGKEPATGTQIMLGITKASLATDSFMSAASFQETTKVLTDAAIKSKVDPLIGLKENVIIGKLIPAGTGMKRYRSVKLDTDMEELNFFDEDEDTDDYEELENVNSEEIVFETLDTAGDADEE